MPITFRLAQMRGQFAGRLQGENISSLLQVIWTAICVKRPLWRFGHSSFIYGHGRHALRSRQPPFTMPQEQSDLFGRKRWSCWR